MFLKQPIANMPSLFKNKYRTWHVSDDSRLQTCQVEIHLSNDATQSKSRTFSKG